MNTSSGFLTIKSRRTLAVVILASCSGLLLSLTLFIPYADSATATVVDYASAGDTFGNTGAGAESALTGYSPDPAAVAACSIYPYNQVCTTGSFFGMYLATGICRGQGNCIATAVTSLGAIGVGAIGGIVNGVIQLGLRALTDTGPTGSPYPSYSYTNPYASQTCTGTRYISPAPTSDPCGIYIPTTTTTNPDINLKPPGGGTTTVGPVTASLSVAPASGKAPLAVTFTVTDTSASCAHAAVSLSAGDGTNPVVAIPATTACAAHTPVTFTYTYGTAGTYKAAITDQGTFQVLQTVTITVTGGTTPPGSGVTNAALSVVPTSGEAPLKVTFTITDTSTACPRAGIILSAGDGSNPVVALPVTNQCTGIPPAQFTYTYAKAGTYTATIMNQDTQQVFQSVAVTVAGGNTTTPGVTNASLSVAPASGPAPLKVTFTITDTSTACPRAGIILSAGDGSNPVVALPVTNQCAGIPPAQFTYTYAKAGTYTAAVFNQDTQQVLQTVDVTAGAAAATPGTDTTLATLAVVPASGTAPLGVKFTITDISTACPRSEIVLSAGDGSAPVTALPATVTCIGITPSVLNYTYQKAGNFTVAISNASTRRVIQTASVVVAPGSGDTATPPLTVTPSAPTPSTVNVSSSLLNLSSGSGSNSLAPNNAIVPKAPTVQSGTWGDIQANASGATITAGAHGTDGRTGVAGFYGYDTVQGVTPQNLAKQMCASRPWGNSTATAVIPPSFYDSICTARGYKTGTPPPATNAGAGSVTPKSPAPSAAAKTSKATTSPAAPAAPAVPPKVYITAVPSSVKLGSRTSIFWNAVGVKSCLITSPDGSFSGNTLYGAASTVPLTGETVFSIVCIKPDGSQIPNFVKVRMAI